MGTNQTFDGSVRTALRTEKTEHSVFVNHNQSDGFDLSESVGPTAPPFSNLTLQGKSRFAITDGMYFSLAGRFYEEDLNRLSRITVDDVDQDINDNQTLIDWNVNPIFGFRWKDATMELRHYSMAYRFNSNVTFVDNNSVFENTFFDQNYHKSEMQLDWVRNASELFTVGTGHIVEDVQATRYRQNPVFRSFFGFVQHDWTISSNLSLITGVRGDHHSEYGGQLSPKFAGRYQFSENSSLKVSAGRGFKAPDFRQLLLSFVNAQAGYAVFGTREIEEQIRSLQAQGDIARILIDPASVAELRAEQSWAFNIGFDQKFGNGIQLKFNLFHNNISNLIDTQPVAQRANNANVFSYLNLNSVVLQGIETEVSWDLTANIQLQAGYQYLDSRDRDVIRRLRDGNVFRFNSDGLPERVPVADYGGLVNRSRHMANFMAFIDVPSISMDFALRGQLRGRFGFADLNGNGIIDAEQEYVDGYGLWNLTATRDFKDQLSFFASVENILNHTDPINLPFLPGRMIFFGINLNIK
jgi:outer membrane receptor for ferrienterochelin and colicins